MARIAPAVARDTRVCIYDRAGRGWSEHADSPQDGITVANDLHTLLQRGNVPGPYVLAGHSFGGLYALIFTNHYPDEVAGMVLDDLADKPRVVVTASSGHDEAEFAAQDALATLSVNSSHLTVQGATHQSVIDEDAPTTIRAILDVVSSVRSGQPLRK